MKNIVFYVFILILMASCSTSDIERCVVSGMIYDNNNEGISGVQVCIDGKNIAETDVYGHFILDGSMIDNEITLVFHKKGYEEKSVAVSSISPSSLIYVKLRSYEEIMNSILCLLESDEFLKSQEVISDLMNTDYDHNYLHYLQALLFYKMNDIDHCLSELEKIEVDESSRNWVLSLQSKCGERIN